MTQLKQRDIGGPIVINTAPATAGTPAIYTIVGINSYTKGYDYIRLYIYAIDSSQITMVIGCLLIDWDNGGLKTRVSAYRDWIDKAN